MEIVISLLGLAITLGSILFSRTDRLLREMRDVLVEIRDRL
jgi:hypothetical protein